MERARLGALLESLKMEERDGTFCQEDDAAPYFTACISCELRWRQKAGGKEV